MEREKDDERKASIQSYSYYVKAQSVCNPCLLNLDNFLTIPTAGHGCCRIVALDFRRDVQVPFLRTKIPQDDLPTKLRSDGDLINPLQGRIFIIEDLTKDLIELLGSELEIDPLFFAMHLHASQKVGLSRQTPNEATLPSRLLSQDYINISYHRSVATDNVHNKWSRYVRNTVINRKLVFLPSTKIGLAQHCASVVKIEGKRSFWIAFVLVDPAIDDMFYVDDRKDIKSMVHLSTRPYLGTYEDFMEPFSTIDSFDAPGKARGRGMWDDLEQYWERSVPVCFDQTNPTIQSLAYYPLRIVAAEWVKYIAVMHECLIGHEYHSNGVLAFEEFLTRLRELQCWRRRKMLTQQKVRSVLCLLRSWMAKDPNDTIHLQPLITDYEYIDAKIEECGRMLENNVSVITSVVQILEARRASVEASNITRLTILALIFVPLTYVSSLFSMNSSNAPGSSHFWVYFAVALPVTLLVFTVARAPSIQARSILAWLKACRRDRHNDSELATPIQLGGWSAKSE